jgi:hypothetical protein
MPRTQYTEQPDLSGGFNPSTDPLKTRPNEWIVCSNALVSKPAGDASGISTNVGSAISRPPMRTPPDASVPTFGYPQAVPSRFFVARLDNSETWVFGGGSNQSPSFATPISQGNASIEFDGTVALSTQTFLGVFTIASPIDITNVYNDPDWTLLVDDTIATFSGTAHLTVYLENSNGQNAQYGYDFNSGTTPTPAQPLPLAYVTETGSFDPTTVTSVRIEFYTDTGDSLDLKLADLRFESATTNGIISSASSFGQGTTASSSTGAIITNLEGTCVLAVSQDALLLGLYPLSYWIKLRTGLTYQQIIGGSHPIDGTRVYFAQFPNASDPSKYIMGISDGVDFCFTYDPNAPLGAQFDFLSPPTNAIQTITPNAFAASGAYKLVWNGQTTASIAFDATESQIQTALSNLSNIGFGNVRVTGNLANQSAGGPVGYDVEFIGTLAGQPASAFTISNNTLKDINGANISVNISSPQSGETINGVPVSGSWCYSINGELTTPLAYNSTAAQIQTALENLSSVGSGNVTVETDLTPVIKITFSGSTSGNLYGLLQVANNTLKDAQGNQVFINTTGTQAGAVGYSGAVWDTYFSGSPTGLTGDDIFVKINTTTAGASSYNANVSQVETVVGATAFGAVTVTDSAGTLPWEDMCGGSLPTIRFTWTGIHATPITGLSYGASTVFRNGAGNPINLALFNWTEVTPDSQQTNFFTDQIQTSTFSIYPVQTWRYVETYKNMMTLCGSNTLPMTLRPSAIDNFTDFNVTGLNDVTLNGVPGERLTGAYDMDDYLLISTNLNIWNLYGSNSDSTTGDFTVRKSKSLVGCIEKGAGVRVGPGFYFYSGEDFYVYDGVQSKSLTNGKMNQIAGQVPATYKRAVTVEFDLQRNLLVWQLPQQNGSTIYWISLCLSLDNGAWGVIGDTGILLSQVTNTTGSIGFTTNGTLGNVYCGVGLDSDGSDIRPVFFQFGEEALEWDPPADTSSAFGDNLSLVTAFNFCKSPHITKDFMRMILTVRNLNPVIWNPGFMFLFGEFGTANGELKFPRGITTDSSGNTYVVDTSNNRVQIFDSTGTYVSKFGSSGTGNGQFTGPTGIALDGSGNIYVVDSSNNRVQKFDSTGAYVSQFGSLGSGNGQFHNPNGITFDASGNIYVTDGLNHRFQKFNSSGTYVSQFGTSGTGNGQFNNPYGIVIDSNGYIYVTDTTLNRVQKFTSGGVYVSQWGSTGTGDGQFTTASGIAIDLNNYLYVVDLMNARIQVFDVNGKYLGQWGTNGSAPGQFSLPTNVTINSSGNVIVADTGNSRIEVFSNANPYISLFLFSDGDISTIRQYITNLTPSNGKIDVLLNGVVGESIAVGILSNIGSEDTAPIEISGYLVYWQAVEDL